MYRRRRYEKRRMFATGGVVTPEKEELKEEPKEEVKQEVMQEVKEEPKKEEEKEQKEESKEPVKREVRVNKGKDISDNIKDLPSVDQAFYNRVKEDTIKSITIVRAPVDKKISSFLNTLSLGALKKAQKKLGYDSLFHLGIKVVTNKGTYLIDKRANVSIENFKSYPNGESLDVDLKDKEITIKELLNKTKSSMGSKFYSYNAANNNCQKFINAILSSNGLSNNETKKFILQNSEQIIGSLPSYTKSIADKITDFGSVTDKVLQKFGIKAFNEGGVIQVYDSDVED